MLDKDGRQLASEREEHWLNLALDAGGLGPWEINLITGAVVASPQLCQVFGVADDGGMTLRKHWAALVLEEDRPLIQPAIEAAVAGRAKYHVQYRIRRPDGAVRWLDSRGDVVPDDQGRPTRLIGVCSDITERKRAEETLRASEELARRQLAEIESIYHSAPVGLCVFDRDLRYLRINERLAKINGLPVGDHLGRTVRDVMPVLADFAEGIARRILETGEPVLAVELTGETPAMPGVQRTWVEDWLPLRDARGEVAGISVVVAELTERKRAEERTKLLSEITAQLLVSKHPQQIVESLCRRVLPHLGCHAFFNFLVDERAGRLRLNACAGISEEAVREIQWLDYGVAVCGCAARDGYRIVAEHIQTMPDPRADLVRSFGIQAYACHPLLSQGQVIGTLSFGSRTKPTFSEDDLSLMKAVVDQVAVAMQRLRLLEELEQRVAERTAEADRRAAQLRAMVAELSRAEQRERRRLSQVLHDHLQQILVAARMKVRRLQRQVYQEEATAQIADEIDELIDQCISESRSLTMELSPPVLYDGGLAAGLDWLARRVEEQHGLPVDVLSDPAADPPDMDLRAFLFQAVRELLFNVVKHARASRARVSMGKTAAGEFRIEVRDDGGGCDPRRLAGQASSAGGFGLFSVRERLELLGGRLEIDTGAEQGTRVVIVVPPSETAGGAEKSRAAHRSGAPTPGIVSKSQGGLRVLLADDHPVVRKGLADLLREQAGIDVVIEARDGQEAVDMALEVRPDVVVMDITMPRLDGIEATRRIKAELPQVRVIGLSMHEDASMVKAMCDAGASDYLRKDIASDALVVIVLGEEAVSSPAR